jgi:DNA mismatch endonuclease (patch repair protein)
VKDLPGKPDIVLPKYKTVIFVNGCFWHGHSTCTQFKPPKSRQAYWIPKIKNNRIKDKENIKKIKQLGYKVILIWECEINNIDKLEKLIIDVKEQ